MSVDRVGLESAVFPSIDKETLGVERSVLTVNLFGSLGERMLQFMVARRLVEEARGCQISNVTLPEWSIDHPRLPSPPGPEITISRGQLDVRKVASLLSSGEIACAKMAGCGQRFSSFPGLELCRSMFPANEKDYPGFGPEFLVCDIKIADAAGRNNEHCPLLPIEFYRDLARSSGLKVVFMGQIEDNAYCRALRQRFPDAVFQPTRGVITDFQTFRNSKNLVPTVDALSWLGAWLSHARRIFLPVSGMFHPVQCPDIDLLPDGDERYTFYLFPINYALPIDRFEEAHRALQFGWRQVRFETIAAMRSAMPRRPRRLDQYLEQFDGVFYLQASPDVAKNVVAGRVKSRDHYIMHGFREGRPCFAFDPYWYSTEYPQAAFEVGQGDYVDLRHHFVEVGAKLGYKPICDTKASIPRWPLRLDKFVAVFHETFYLHEYADVARALNVGKGKIKASDHYVMHGFREGRFCFALDDNWYGREYPLAAFEVGQGHYRDFRHHFVEAGFLRGYKPTPPDNRDEIFIAVQSAVSAKTRD